MVISSVMSKSTISNNLTAFVLKFRSFCLSLAVFGLFGTAISFAFSQADIFLAINGVHHPLADRIFMVFTNLGDGLCMVAVGCFLLFVRFKFAIATFAGFLLTGLVAQLIKRSLAFPRPAKFFAGQESIYCIPDYPVHMNHSFPSGHTTTAFSLAVVLIYVLRCQKRIERQWQYMAFLFALMVGYSRIYLAQHFFGDVCLGAFLGSVLTVLLIWYMENTKWYHSRVLNGKINPFWFMEKQRTTEQWGDASV